MQQRELLLLFVAYHPTLEEVRRLVDVCAGLSERIGYAVVVNDHRPGEAVDQLALHADVFVVNTENLGYGRAVNLLTNHLTDLPPHIAVLNTDVSWQPGCFEQLLDWLQCHPEVSLAVPSIQDSSGVTQQLCKQNPSVLALLSRRFLPSRMKPRWLKRYDDWYTMAHQSYGEIFDAPYLSGCCMLISTAAFRSIGGFDERYFLYLEDADLTRSLARTGRCVHLPIVAITHGWGRGNYRSLRLMMVNIVSAFHYFSKWGWTLW